MEKLLEQIIDDISLESEEITADTFWAEIKYDTSFFVNVSGPKWFIKSIEMAESDINIINNLFKELSAKYVEDYKLEDRDSEFLYKYNTQGLLKNSNRIQVAFADATENLINTGDNENEQNEITIHNYEGNSYPPNDEVKLIVHRMVVGNSKILVFCNQSYTSLVTTSIKTIFNNQLKNIEKSKYYKIKNDISLIMTVNNYYIASVDYFEKIFSFDSQIKRNKQIALKLLSESELIQGLELAIPELNKGYMARSVSMIRMNKDEMKGYVKRNENAISSFCREYQVGVSFDISTNKFTVEDGKVASLFLTYLFSHRMAKNIEGELVYYKTFGKLNKTAVVNT
ncbi:Kiwa anti-phage protein KwaB-like domain-containing protein [Brevibacillus centrosporus]|uniref:DUF4868 domain-containing protein n=1 Tax=Brevibacillus centrosporus TaxID=54910 RepID=A0A1I3L5J1_9BACL|nr:Kiwa anti-phage protein KwaB-like domain-containing protein [Brevibacillus centrosporus]SFI79655.1 protein of unknown function [Brevibacillus centrosporus]